MSELVVKPVTTRRDRKQFLQFPWSLYHGDPNWVPPLRGNQAELVGYARHPFYERNTVQTFLALRDGEVCGRIAAIVNQGHIERYGERRGFFGFFECRDDPEVAGKLFDAARAWLAEREIHALRGPTNPSLNYELGLLIDGFDSPPTFMMTYNPPYYQRLVEDYGFRKTQDLYAYLGKIDELPAAQARFGSLAQQILERMNLRMRSMNKKRYFEDVNAFLSIYNRSLVNTWGFVPMSEGEVAHMAAGLRHLMIPDLSAAAELDGQMIGAVFGLPDYNPRIKAIDGRLFPTGFLRLLWKRHRLKRIRLISTNVLPEYQRMGVGLVLMNALVPRGVAWGLEEAEFSWVLESNELSRGSLEKAKVKRVKTWRLYDLDGPG